MYTFILTSQALSNLVVNAVNMLIVLHDALGSCMGSCLNSMVKMPTRSQNIMNAAHQHPHSIHTAVLQHACCWGTVEAAVLAMCVVHARTACCAAIMIQHHAAERCSRVAFAAATVHAMHAVHSMHAVHALLLLNAKGMSCCSKRDPRQLFGPTAVWLLCCCFAAGAVHALHADHGIACT